MPKFMLIHVCYAAMLSAGLVGCADKNRSSPLSVRVIADSTPAVTFSTPKVEKIDDAVVISGTATPHDSSILNGHVAVMISSDQEVPLDYIPAAYRSNPDSTAADAPYVYRVRFLPVPPAGATIRVTHASATQPALWSSGTGAAGAGQSRGAARVLQSQAGGSDRLGYRTYGGYSGYSGVSTGYRGYDGYGR